MRGPDVNPNSAFSGLFRVQAQEHLLQGDGDDTPLRVSPPWTWAVVCIVSIALIALILASLFGSVEVNVRAPGIVRPAFGLRPIASPTRGTVAEVTARSGEAVEAGQVLVRLDAPDLQAERLQAERRVELLSTRLAAVTDTQTRLHHSQASNVSGRIDKLKTQLESQRRTVAVYRQKWQAMNELAQSRMVGSLAVAEAQEQMFRAERELMGFEQGVEAARQELAALDSRQQADLWQYEQALADAQARLQALRIVADQLVVRAPVAGVLEALVVAPGDSVEPGQMLAKLIPKGVALQAVVFLPEQHRAFVKPGDPVELELDQLPYGEFGTVRARVRRISQDLASSHEVRDALTDPRDLVGSSYRVELDLAADGATRAAHVGLRSGMLGQARFTVRRQRPITLFLQPLRKWLG